MAGSDPTASAWPDRMHGVVLVGHGGPEQLHYRDDLPVPRPADDEVLLRVGAAAVNNTDVNARVGWYSRSVTTDTASSHASAAAGVADGGWGGGAFAFPRIQGIDACGHVVAVGAHVDARRIGERVLVDPVIRHGSSRDVAYLGSDRDGAFAQYVAVPAVNAHRVASALSDVELATFPCAYGTAENLLSRAGVAAGETVLVTGASGGVGSAAVQLAALRGARVVGIAQPDKTESILALGAAQVLPRGADVAEALARESVDVVIDVVGGPAFPGLLEVLRRGGRYAVAGAIGGPVVGLDLRTLYLKDLTLFGCTVPPPGLFARLVATVERGGLRPLVSAVYPLREIARAQADFLAKRHTGKIVLVP